MRLVPDGIARPSYAHTGEPAAKAGVAVKTESEIARMRSAGRAAAEILGELGTQVAPGVTTDELDAICHDLCIERGGYPSPLNYHGYPKSLCTSVNEVICHGIPDSRPLADGDIVNLDVTIYLDGVHGDTSATFAVGDPDPESARLVKVTRECLERGIRAVRAGGLLNEIGRAIEAHATRHGYGVVRDFVGHGIGSEFHMFPNVPHYYDPNLTVELHPGMTFTIEPMITIGTHEAVVWEDNWTAVTADLARTAQFEHTVLVTPDGVEILTATPDPG
ncbi:MAG: type I methionyl aminopeptidase [Acidimicrobiia bacterium]|nr:type I methionyl aminopeptidase [Acidimicrobiia bacterium]